MSYCVVRFLVSLLPRGNCNLTPLSVKELKRHKLGLLNGYFGTAGKMSLSIFVLTSMGVRTENCVKERKWGYFILSLLLPCPVLNQKEQATLAFVQCKCSEARDSNCCFKKATPRMLLLVALNERGFIESTEFSSLLKKRQIA